MTISVIIPCLNSAEYLQATLISLLNQTDQPAQIIVADNGSTDGSLEIARAFAPRVSLIEVKEAGAPAARAAGAELAEGSALMFMDADDLVGPGTLSHLAQALESDACDIACCPWYRYEFAEGVWSVAPGSCPPRIFGDDALSAWLSGWYQPPCSVLWSRQAYERSGGWDNQVTMNQDGDVMMRGLLAGNRLRQIAAGAAYYRRLPGERQSVSSQRKTRNGIQSRMFVLERLTSLIDERGMTQQYALPLAEAYRALLEDAAASDVDLEPLIRIRLEQCENQARLGSRLIRTMQVRLTRAASALGSKISLGGGAAIAPAEQANALGHATNFHLQHKDRPLVTVVIPAYNRARTIARSIDSVLQQDYHHFELLVVDDASSDDTVAVVRQYADPRIRVIQQPCNAGAGAARNRGIKEARGDFIALLDSGR